MAAEMMPTEAWFNWKAVLIRLNRIAREHPRNITKLSRHLLRAPHQFCPLAVEVAQEDGDPIGMVLAKVLKTLRDPALAVRLYEIIPEKTTPLAHAAIEATKQRLDQTPGGTFESDQERGSYLNNLAVRLASIGEYAAALRFAKLALKQAHWRSQRQ